MTYKTSFQSNNNDLREILTNLIQAFRDPVEDKLIDFEYTKNDNGTYTITGWKGTYGGKASTELIIPNDPRILL